MMLKFEALNTQNAPQPTGAYSQAVLAQDPFLFISGQVPRLSNGELLTNCSIEEQTKRVLENIQEIAQSAGMSLTDDVDLFIAVS